MMKVLMKIFHFFLPNGKQEYYIHILQKYGNFKMYSLSFIKHKLLISEE